MASLKVSSKHSVKRFGWILLSTGILMLQSCAGPPALKNAVTSYDETTAQLDQQLLLVNIARLDAGTPIHFTTTSSIAATFNWTTTVGATGRAAEAPGFNFLDLTVGGSASENPTFSIIPIAGEEFTKRILKPFDEDILNFFVFQERRFEQSIRLMVREIEVQNADGTFVRTIDNDPTKRKQYEEFRRLAVHLQYLDDNQQLFVRPLIYEDTIVTDFGGQLRAQDIVGGLDNNVTWRQKPDGRYKLERLVFGRLTVTNFDPESMSDRERAALNKRIRKSPASFVYLDIRAGHPGGEFPIRGVMKLRSLLQVIGFIAQGIRAAPEFDVPKDPRTGETTQGPAATVKILVGDEEPPINVPSAQYRGKYFSVADTPWDRQGFELLSYLFQTAVAKPPDVGIPITISK